MRILQFSGGKDSLALLYLMHKEWKDITVMWCNPGAPHESTLGLMAHVRAMVPHFIEVKGTQPMFVERVGFPSDIVPAGATPVGQMVEGVQGDRFVSAYDCCAANLWQPMHAASKLLGATDIYRGQKEMDRRKAPFKDGYKEDGITYHFPLQGWTDFDVREYLGGRLPLHYQAGELSSRDCWNCTAYLDENAARIQALPVKQRMFVMGKLASMLEQVDNSRAHLVACLTSETVNEHEHAS